MTGAQVRLCLLNEARDRDGEPRAALVVPPSPGRYGKRPVIVVFASLGAALNAKRSMERTADAERPGGSAAA